MAQGTQFGPEVFPQMLMGRKTCTWRQLGTRGKRVHFTLFYFDIPHSTDCSEDSLSIHNGIATFSPKIVTL